MKKVVSVICIVISMLLTLASCNNKEQGSSIVGRWQWVQTEVLYYLEGIVESSHKDTPSQDVYLTFNSDGTCSYTQFQGGSEAHTTTGSYNLWADELAVTFKDGSGVDSHTYTIESISGSTLILVEEDDYWRGGTVYQEVTRVTLKKAK